MITCDRQIKNNSELLYTNTIAVPSGTPELTEELEAHLLPSK